MVKILFLGLIFISPPFLKVILLRLSGAKIGRKAYIGWFSAVDAQQITIGEYASIKSLSVIRLGGAFNLDAYAEISSFTLIYGSSSLNIGRGSYIGPQCLLNADEPVEIGDGSALGARCMVFTHGSFLPYTEGYWVKHSRVDIGHKVWCAAGVFIHPGVEIGDNSFVNSRSVVNGVIPMGSVVDGNPAKVIYPMEKVQRKMSPRTVDLALERILQDFAEVGLRRELRIQAIEAKKQSLRFKWKGQNYSVCIIPSTGKEPSTPHHRGEIEIFLVNCEGWPVPQKALVFDLPQKQTRFCSDPIHTELRLFMLRYYGVRFFDNSPLETGV